MLRALYESTHYAGLRIVAINDLADTRTLAHLTRYDSTHGRFLGHISEGDAHITVAGDDIRVLRSGSVATLPWSELGVDLVLECSGVFKSRQDAQRHLRAGARKVLFSHPAEPDVDATIVTRLLDAGATITGSMAGFNAW